jgi:hypothetical protein
VGVVSAAAFPGDKTKKAIAKTDANTSPKLIFFAVFIFKNSACLKYSTSGTMSQSVGKGFGVYSAKSKL